MALLFEKCEQASQTPDCPSSDSFDVDIQAFVHHQEQDGKPFFSEDPELDSLVRIALEWDEWHECQWALCTVKYS